MLLSISKTGMRSCQSFFTKKLYNKIVRSLDCLSRSKVLYVHVDITVLVRQKNKGASQHLPVKSLKSNTRIGCERCSRCFKKTLARRQLIVLVHLIITLVF